MLKKAIRLNQAVLSVIVLMACSGFAGLGAAPEMSLPDSRTGLPLSRCRIVAPEDPDVQKAVHELASLITSKGGQACVVPPRNALDSSGLRLLTGEGEPETLILAGNIADNRAMLPLYAMFLDFTDAYHPGGDGFVIRTLPDAPTRGRRTIILGGSNGAGTIRAVRRACEILAALKPGSLFPLTLEADLDGEARSALKEIAVPREGVSAAYLYGLTGEKRFAEASKEFYFVPGGSGYYEVIDYDMEPMLRSLTQVYDSGVFLPTEQQSIQQALLNTLIHNQNEYWRARDGSAIGGRHQTMGTSAFLSVARFLLRRGNPNPEARALLERWRSECEAYFANAITVFHDDLEGIPSYHSVQPMLNYALESGEAGYFRRADGLSPLQLAILRAYASVDNLGYYCGTGTYEEARPGTVKAGILLGYPLAAQATINGDAGAAWLLRHFRGTQIDTWGLLSGYGAHAFNVGSAVPESEPRSLLGMIRVPLGRYRYDRHPRRASPGAVALPVPYRHTFEKLAFRDAFQPEGQYLALQGYQGTGADNLPPRDANSIIRYTDRGHVWLIANTDRQGNFYRNAVSVSDGESHAPGWAGCDLVGTGQSGRALMAVSRLGGYNGSEWTRHILWLRGKAFAVVDAVRLTAPGRRQVTCTFRSVQPAVLQNGIWTARSGNAVFRLLNADHIPIDSRRDGPEGAAIPTVLRQRRTVNGSPGSVALFRNLFYASAASRPQAFEIKAFGKSALLILDKQGRQPGLLAVRGAGKRLEAGPFRSDGDAFYIGPEGVLRVGGSFVTYRGKKLPDRVGDPLPNDAAAELSRMWLAASKPDGKNAAASFSKLPVKWAYRGLTSRSPAVLAPAVSASQPPAAGSLDDLTDGFIPLWTGDVFWPYAKALVLTFDLRREENISGIELATGLVSGMNTLPSKGWREDKPVRVELSRDGFRRDREIRHGVFQAGYTIEPLHKGTVFAMGRWRLAGLNRRARYVRLVFPPGPVTLREVFIRRAEGNEARFGPSLAADLDGDGQEEMAITTDTGEMTVLDSNGRKRWGYRFEGPATCLQAGSLSPDRPGRLLVGTREARLYCFTPDGRLDWVTDFTPLGGDLPVPFSIALMRPDADARRRILVGNYARFSFVSPEGQLEGNGFAYGADQTMSLTGLDLTGSKAEDALLYNIWGNLTVIDGEKRNATDVIPSPQGEGLALKPIPDGMNNETKALVASENGVGILRTRAGQYDWLKPFSPLACTTTADLDGDDREEVLIGRRDGWLLALSREGQVRRKVLIGDEVRSVVVEPGAKKRLWIATGSGLLLLDHRFKQLHRFAVTARRLEQTKELLWIFGDDGAIRAVRFSDVP